MLLLNKIMFIDDMGSIISLKDGCGGTCALKDDADSSY